VLITCMTRRAVVVRTQIIFLNRRAHDHLADEPSWPLQGLEVPEVCRGWELAVATMRPNEIAEVVSLPAGDIL
jgi:hypothetical protein